jgi:ribosomal-protein-alanine N-acetyltransferase
VSEYIFPIEFPLLETDRLFLRQIMLDDAEGMFKNFSDPEVAKWFFEHPLTNLEQVVPFIDAFKNEFEQKEGLTWAVVLKTNDLFVGTCGYGSVAVGVKGDMGFDLAKNFWGQGLMTEALISTINYGFESLGLSKVEAHTYSSNTRAIGLLEKLGFGVEKVTDEDHYFALERNSWTV